MDIPDDSAKTEAEKPSLDTKHEQVSDSAGISQDRQAAPEENDSGAANTAEADDAKIAGDTVDQKNSDKAKPKEETKPKEDSKEKSGSTDKGPGSGTYNEQRYEKRRVSSEEGAGEKRPLRDSPRKPRAAKSSPEPSKRTERVKQKLIGLSPGLKTKIEAVFVPSPEYEKSRRSIIDSERGRVLIVYGPKKSGRFSCAVRLGFDLWRSRPTAARFIIYDSSKSDDITLLELARNPHLENNTIYIIRDAFDNGIALSDLSNYCRDEINKELESHNIYFILTASQDVSSELLSSCVNAGFPDKSKVFEKHLDWYREGRGEVLIEDDIVEKVREVKDLLLDRSESPGDIVNFFLELAHELNHGAGEEAPKKIIEGMGKLNQWSLRTWFNSLSPNEMLYAMLVDLFHGLDRHTLNDIYTGAVDSLRELGVSNLKDSRETGLNDILEKIRTKETDTRTVAFIDIATKTAVDWQISNHHHLLWSLVPALVEVIRNYNTLSSYASVAQLGGAIGRLGISHKEKFSSVLEALVRSEDFHIVLAAGLALEAFCHASQEDHGSAKEWFRNWVKSGDPQLMWASGVIFPALYDGLAHEPGNRGKSDTPNLPQPLGPLSTIREALTMLAEKSNEFNEDVRRNTFENAYNWFLKETALEDGSDLEEAAYDHLLDEEERWAKENRGAACYAIVETSRRHPADMVELISGWLGNDRHKFLRDLAEMAGCEIFEELSGRDFYPKPELHEPLLGLIGPLLSTKIETVDVVTGTLLLWSNREGWKERVHATLLRLANRTRGAEAELLRKSLINTWLTPSETPEDLRRIGQAVLARSYAMAGMPMSMPGSHSGAILFDASRLARMDRVGARSACRLFECLNPLMDVLLFRMGEAGRAAEPDHAVCSTTLVSQHNLPRLIMPAIEELDSSGTCFVLGLSWAPVLDAHDVYSSSWSDKFLLANAGEDDSLSKEHEIIIVDRHLPESDDGIQKVLSALGEKIGRAVAKFEPKGWGPFLEAELRVDINDLDAMISVLSQYIEQLDETGGSDGRRDSARTIVCSIVWLAAKDLARCIALLRLWMEDDRELHRLIANTCGKALFRLYAHLDPPPPVGSHGIMLGVVPALAAQDWESAEAVIGAAQRWSSKFEWAQRLSVGIDDSRSEMAQLVDASVPKNYENLKRALEEWKISKDDQQPPEFMVDLVNSLQLRMALKARQPLPTLPEGHSYGLIIADVSAEDERDEVPRQNIAALACAVVKKLQKDEAKTLETLVFRMGEDYPVAASGQTIESKHLIGAGALRSRPRLIGPLLEKLPPEQTRFVLLLAGSPNLDAKDWILDVKDWIGTPWSERFEYYPDPNRRDTSLPPAQYFRQLDMENENFNEDMVIVKRLKLK